MVEQGDRVNGLQPRYTKKEFEDQTGKKSERFKSFGRRDEDDGI